MALNFKPLQYEPGGSMYAPRIGEETWNLYRPRIEQLYIGHGKTLDEVMAVMAHEHDFRPTESQYKIQFRRWKLRKNRVGGVPPPQKVGTATSSAGPANVEPTTNPEGIVYDIHKQQPVMGAWESPSLSSTSFSPQATLRTESSTSSIRSPSGSITSYSTDVQRTPKGNAATTPPTSTVKDVPSVSPLLPLDTGIATSFLDMSGVDEPSASAPSVPDPAALEHENTDPVNSQAPDAELYQEVDNGPPPHLNSHLSDEGGELSLLTGSLLDCLISITCDPLKVAELNDEGCYWLWLVARHLLAVQSKFDLLNGPTVILQALFKYKQANVFYPNAKMSTISVLSEIAPTTDVRDLVQQVGWIYGAKIRAAEGDNQQQRAVKANWLMARSILAGLYRMRSQASEAIKLANSSLKTLRSMAGIPSSYSILVCEELEQAYADAGDAKLGREVKSRMERYLNEAGNPQQLESVKYFYEHCFKLLESATVYAWSGYNDFKDFASLLEGLCGHIHWRTTTLFAYFWIRWRENETRSRTLDNIAQSMGMRAPDIIAAFVILLYSRMPADYHLPPVQRLFEDAVKAVRILTTDVDPCVPLRMAWFSSFAKYLELHGDLDPSSSAACATRSIAMCLCHPDFSSLRELLSSEKYQRLPSVIPTLSMTPRSSMSGFRMDIAGNIDPSGSSMVSRSMRDTSSMVDLPSNFMRRSWSSLGSGLLLGQRVGSLRSFYTSRSSRRTRDSRVMERTWDSDDDDEEEDGDVKMTD